MASQRVAGRLGALPPDLSRPHLLLSAHLEPAAVAPSAPPLADWLSAVPEWPIFANDRLGDCVWAMTGHVIEAWTTYAEGHTVEVTDADVIKGYSDVTGYDPNQTQPDGTNPTDQGTNIQDALNYWRKTGVGGHTIVAFARVDHTNLEHVQAAIDLFGAVCVGVALPAIAQQQFADGQPWDVVPDDGGIVGGHAVHFGAYDAGRGLFGGTTWGAKQLITFAWARTYVSEVWAPITREWIEANGSSPGGIAAGALGDDFSALTGQPNPFPNPAPTPVPPEPVVDAADQALVAALRPWLREHHSGDNKRAAVAVKTWMATKGLQ